MSRSGYSDGADYCEDWQWIMPLGQLTRAIKGKRGQAFLRELIEALDAMPDKRLISDALAMDGAVCALGCVGVRRGMDMTGINIYEPASVAKAFGIASRLASQIAYENDDALWDTTPERRWKHMRDWASSYIENEP